MKLALGLVLVAFLATAHALFGISRQRIHELSIDPYATRKETRALPDKWITQKLDQFDSRNTATWEMRYLENDAYFEPNGPIFIYIGGEWTISAGSIEEGQLITDMAKEYKGVLFYTEHRYYGRSHPTT